MRDILAVKPASGDWSRLALTDAQLSTDKYSTLKKGLISPMDVSVRVHLQLHVNIFRCSFDKDVPCAFRYTCMRRAAPTSASSARKA